MRRIFLVPLLATFVPLVNDFVHHKTIILHAGQSYLARARE